MFSKSMESPSPRNHTTHHVIKDIADRLRPHLIRLNESPTDKCGQSHLYLQVIEEILSVKKQVTNQDSLCAIHNAINQLEKAIELTNNSALNEEILWHLQEVMAFLFRVQNLPS
ncbi:MAG: hypothetical protein WCG14_05250 [Chlamydiia bacterium]